MILTVQLLSAAPASARIVNTLRGFDDKERGWSGAVEGAVSSGMGNSEYLQIEIAAAMQYQNESHRWRLLGRNMRLTTSGKEQAENRMAHLRHNYRILPWLASVAFVQGQYSPFQRIETRVLIGAGGRFDVVREEKWSVAFGATCMREDEELTGGNDRFTTDYRFSFFTSVFRDVSKGVDIDVTGFYQPLPGDFSDARALAAVNLRSEITETLYLLFNYGLEYDSRPAAGVEESDQTLRSGFGYSF